jgi:hypothetical protein
MKDNNLANATIEELNARKKTLSTITIVLAVLILLYAGYFLTKLISGTWQANNTLGIVGLGALGVVSSMISIQLGKIGKEIKSRDNSN